MVDKEPTLPNDDVKLPSDVQDEARGVQDEVRLKPSAHADAKLSWDEVWRGRKWSPSVNAKLSRDTLSCSRVGVKL
jgi:hypothetical protein